MASLLQLLRSLFTSGSLIAGGTLVFETTETSQSRNGMLNGTEQPACTYVWTVKAIDNKDAVLVHPGRAQPDF